MARMDDKVVVITGGARGQGAAHTRRLLEEGAKVVCTDILVEEGQALADDLGDNVKFIKHDVTNADEWEHVINEAENTFGPVNVLVNNAGIAINDSIDEFTEETYRKIIDINQIGVFLGMKAAIPSMRKNNAGSIINISSISGFVGTGGIGYVASKFAVRGMTKTAALELGPENIRVNSIHPGLIETPMIKQDDTAGLIEEIAKSVPMKRVAQPEEVSNLVLFLASDESSYSTGSEFIIDGGLISQ